MSRLLQSTKYHDTTTTNGAISHSTSGDDCLDLFFKAGGLRGRPDEVIPYFSKAMEENEDVAVRIALWLRDVRGGAGERDTFRRIFYYLSCNRPDIAIKLIPIVPSVGRWDDLFSFSNHIQYQVLDYLKDALIKKKDGLCAKWMPREKSSKSVLGYILRKHMGLSAREYRKLLSELSKTVEQKISSHKWKKINYSHVPSMAMNKYRTAFYRHDEERFKKYIESVKEGEVKINASVIHPHELIGSFISNQMEAIDRFYNIMPSIKPSDNIIKAIEAQWYSLPDYVSKGDGDSLVVCDTSGSMLGLPIQVAVALSIYFAERNKGQFRDEFITFSKEPKFQKVYGANLYEKVKNLLSTGWNQNTNLVEVFNLILRSANRQRLKNSDLPSKVIIISDMQFDSAVSSNKKDNFQKIRKLYKKSGYDMPTLVFWNVNLLGKDSPVKFDENRTALISGFSPSILSAVMKGDNLSPIKVMESAVMKDRYNWNKVL